MAILGAASFIPRKTTILPEGGRDFLHRRMMELVGVGVAAAGVVLLLALFTYSPADPSLNHATGRAPHNIVGLPGAYISDLLLQTFGLAIILVPVALITWGVRLVRTHHLGFFGLRLSLLLLALLMMSVACIGLGDVGGAATHAGPGGLVGMALVGRFREFVLTHSSGGSLALIEPACAALAFIAMAPALGMNRTDLPLIFRILRAPFLWSMWLVRAGVGLWRGKPQPLRRGGRPAVAGHRLCRDSGRDRRQPVRSGSLRGPSRTDPGGRRAAAGARFADGRCALCADRAAGRRYPRGAGAVAASRTGHDDCRIGSGPHPVRSPGRPAHRTGPGPAAARPSRRPWRRPPPNPNRQRRPEPDSGPGRSKRRARRPTTTPSRPMCSAPNPRRPPLPPRREHRAAQVGRPRASAPPRRASASSTS